MKKCWRKTGYAYQIHLHQAFLELSNALSIPEQVFERSERGEESRRKREEEKRDINDLKVGCKVRRRRH